MITRTFVTSTARRLQRISSHLQPHRTSSSTPTPAAAAATPHNFRLHELVLGDTPEAWTQAGFTVDTGWKKEQLVFLDTVTVRLTSEGGGLQKIIVGSDSTTSTTSTTGTTGTTGSGPTPQQLALPGLASEIVHLPPAPTGLPPTPSNHPNSTTQFGEIVLYTQQLATLVQQFSQVGIHTHRHKLPKPMGKDNIHACATYYFGDLRLLVFGPVDPNHDSGNNSKNQWMLGQGSATTEVRGYLPLVESMEKLRHSCAQVGAAKKAIQKDRTIATLKSGEITGLTGTFAFLSNWGIWHLAFGLIVMKVRMKS